MKILVVSPWPDGPEMIAGTIIKEVKIGHEIHVLCLTKGGGHGGEASLRREEKIRMEEQRRAASVEGVKNVHFLDMENLNIFDSSESRRAVMNVIRKIRPRMIIMPWFRDTHPDIVATGHIVLASCFLATLPSAHNSGQSGKHVVEIIYMFETMGSLDFNPDVYIDITSVIEEKKNAIKQHKNLAKLYESGNIEDVVEYVLAGDRARGIKCGEGVEYAEAFKRWTYPHGGRLALSQLPED